MKKDKSSLPKLADSKIRTFLVSPYPIALGFVVTVITLITFLVTNNPLVKWLAIFTTVIFGLWALFLLRDWFVKIYAILTWKLLVGLGIGILIGILIYQPVFLPLVNRLAALTAPHIEFLDSFPENNGILPDEIDGISVSFRESIPWPYYLLLNVELTPNTEHYISWDKGNVSFGIIPAEKFPASENRDPYVANARFEYNTKYHVKISGPGLPQPIEFDFYTRPK